MESPKDIDFTFNFDALTACEPSAAPRSLEDVLQKFETAAASTLPDFESPAEHPSVENETSTTVGTEAKIKRLCEGDGGYSGSINWIEVPLAISRDDWKRWRNPALLLRYAKRDEKGFNKIHSIILQSLQLRTLASQVLDGYPGLDFDPDLPTFNPPFEPFFHRWDRLERYRNECQESIDRKHIDLLYGFLQEEFERAFHDLERLIPQGKIRFNLLWAIFPPGCLVFDLQGRDVQCSIVKSWRNDFDGSFELKLTHLDYDGEAYGWISAATSIKPFNSTRHIHEIGIVPQRCLNKGLEYIERLQERGKKSIAIFHNMYQSYQGFIPDLYGKDKFIDERIIVDALEHSRSDSSIKIEVYPIGLREIIPKEEVCVEEPMVNNKRRFNSFEVSKTSSPRSTQAGLFKHDPTLDLLEQHRWTQKVWQIAPEVLLPPIVRGFTLSSKRWTSFRVENISKIAWNDKAFDMLVLPPQRKRLLKALVEEQKNHKVETDDIIRGKGQGLVLFLCGPPGTGKTLTAESIADYLRSPLYALSASQIGGVFRDIEDGLNDTLRLTAIWDAVLLIDEADVFLEKRSDERDSQQRNIRVAALLRVLEYYKGILILTANRPIDLDEALYSRIHLFLRYQPLDYNSRKTVWSNFLRSFTDQINETDIERLANEDLNGRQIKNVSKMARLLATHEKAPLTIDHLRDVISVLKEDN